MSGAVGGASRSPLAVYRPGQLSGAELAARFVDHQGLVDRVIADLEGVEPAGGGQHTLFIGGSGSGKTALLLRLAQAVRGHEALRERLLPVVLPEFQYDVRRLGDFWMGCLDALVRELRLEERGATGVSSRRSRASGASGAAAGLAARAEALRTGAEPSRGDAALEALFDVSAGQGRRLVLFVDNIDRVLDRLAEEQWVVREVLSEPAGPLVLGASGRPLEAAYRYDKAFYDFFKVHELAGVPAEATVGFLRRTARALALPEVERLLGRQPERWAVLRRLTGGVPRRLVQLVAVLALGSGPSAYDDLVRLLDLATPELLARLDTLPRQAQRVVAGLAAHFDPTSAGELAARLGLEVNTVSAQLSRLVNHGWVEKVAYHPASKTGFLVADRFFNLWFLSHAGPVEGRRLSDLVDFLERVEAKEADARELLERARWPGLRGAAEAASSGEREQLRRLAPELQDPARQLAADLG